MPMARVCGDDLLSKEATRCSSSHLMGAAWNLSWRQVVKTSGAYRELPSRSLEVALASTLRCCHCRPSFGEKSGMIRRPSFLRIGSFSSIS